MRGIRIDYGGVAIGAKENFVPDTADKAEFADLSELQEDGLTFPNFGNPCELYSVLLDGNAEPLPDDTDSVNIGWWSEQISNDKGKFATPIELTLTAFDYYYTSSGITLTFDTYNGIFANDIVIRWFRDDALLVQMPFKPDSAFYFCQKKVVDYNKVIITFKGINMPYNKLKLRSIEYGMRVTFYGDELRNAKIIQEIDPLSAQIAINTCDFTLDSKRNIEYTFQERQPVSVYFNDMLRSTSFIKSAKRKSKDVWDIQAEDYIGLMENTVFYGDIYKNKNAVELIKEIMEKANIPVAVSDELSVKTVTGYIPYTNCREALMQVAFAIGAVVDTSNSESVNVYVLDDEVKQTVPLERIMQGQTFDEETKVTAVEVTSHEYIPIEDKVTVYDASESGTGNNIFVKFSEPLHDLTVEYGSLVSRGTNYAVITAYNGCSVKGKKYEHRQIIHRQENTVAEVTDTDNIVSVQNATLVSPANIADVVSRCSDYYSTNISVNLKIVEGKHRATYGYGKYGQFVYNGSVDDAPTKVGETVICETEYLGDITGRILKQTYSLNGGIIIKDSKMKQGG